MYHVASEETYEDGQVVFREDATGDWVYVVISGAVEISKTVEDKRVVIEVLGEGEVFGELGFLGRIRRTATARAVGPTTLGVIDRSFLDNEFNKLSSEFRFILAAVVERFKKMLERASSFQERRDHRVQKALSLAFKDRDAFVKAYSGNISTGGLFVRTRKPLAQGERFLLKLQLPNLAEPLKIQSEVAWAREAEGDSKGEAAGMGIRFLDLAAEESRILKAYVDGAIADDEGGGKSRDA